MNRTIIFTKGDHCHLRCNRVLDFPEANVIVGRRGMVSQYMIGFLDMGDRGIGLWRIAE